MESLHGIIDSQSRYELQQELLLNPNGLNASIDNRFGVVDGSGNISTLRNVSNVNRNLYLNNGVLSNQPLFVPNFFDTNIHAFSTATDKCLVRIEPNFLKDWDSEWWIAMNIEHKDTIGSNARLISVRDLDFLSTEFYINVNSSGIMDIGLTTTTSSNTNIRRKLIRSTNALIDGEVFTLIYHCSGTNDVADYNVYKNASIESFTAVLNQDFTGNTLYPSGINNDVRMSIGARAGGVSLVHQGKFGKIMYGYGEPNVSLIETSLNSSI